MAFRFKQFSVRDDISSMKVGTDAVLLGAWAGSGGIEGVLDIGTGSGVIALMMAQRFINAEVLGIDIHPESVEQARENFISAPWASRMKALKTSLQQLSAVSPHKFDLVVSNPPFFKDSLLPPDPSRTLARHAGTLSFEELISCSSRLLNDHGTLALILPFKDKAEIHALMGRHELYPGREMNVIPVSGREPNRFLSEWGREPRTIESVDLVIRQDAHLYTEDYRKLTADFYLAL